LWPDKWFLHHGNAPCHSSIAVGEFLTENKITTMEHAPYSPDVAPWDLFLFPKIKIHLKGRRFEDLADIQKNTTQQLKAVSSEDFRCYFRSWKWRMERYKRAAGEYFGGDKQ
jgi:transposase